MPMLSQRQQTMPMPSFFKEPESRPCPCFQEGSRPCNHSDRLKGNWRKACGAQPAAQTEDGWMFIGTDVVQRLVEECAQLVPHDSQKQLLVLVVDEAVREHSTQHATRPLAGQCL